MALLVSGCQRGDETPIDYPNARTIRGKYSQAERLRVPQSGQILGASFLPDQVGGHPKRNWAMRAGRVLGARV